MHEALANVGDPGLDALHLGMRREQGEEEVLPLDRELAQRSVELCQSRIGVRRRGRGAIVASSVLDEPKLRLRHVDLPRDTLELRLHCPPPARGGPRLVGDREPLVQLLKVLHLLLGLAQALPHLLQLGLDEPPRVHHLLRAVREVFFLKRLGHPIGDLSRGRGVRGRGRDLDEARPARPGDLQRRAKLADDVLVTRRGPDLGGRRVGRDQPELHGGAAHYREARDERHLRFQIPHRADVQHVAQQQPGHVDHPLESDGGRGPIDRAGRQEKRVGEAGEAGGDGDGDDEPRSAPDDPPAIAEIEIVLRHGAVSI